MAEVTLYMMVGVPGSGKSFIAKGLNCPIVSSDAIRKELYGSEDDQSHNGEVFNEVHVVSETICSTATPAFTMQLTFLVLVVRSS